MVPGLPLRDGEAVLRSLDRKVAELPPAWRSVFAPSIARLAAVPPLERELVTTHGDFAPRNLIDSPEGLKLIDLDRLQLADPARDVAYYGAWIFVTRLAAGARPSWRSGARLAAAYTARRWESDLATTLDFHRIAALVRIAHGWSSLAGDDATVAAIAAEVRRLTAAWVAGRGGTGEVLAVARSG